MRRLMKVLAFRSLKSVSQPAGGFTLIEMMVVLAVLGVLMATLYPSFGPPLARAKMHAASRDIASALRFARGVAIRTGREAVFILDIQHHLYTVPEKPKPFSVDAGITLGLYTSSSELFNDSIGRIRFYPDGSSTGGKVTLKQGSFKTFIEINWLTGEVKSPQDESVDEAL